MTENPNGTPDPDEQETLGASTPEPGSGLDRDPDEWATGEEPMTSAQRSYLDTLAREAGEELPADLTKAEASKHIDRLQDHSKRVQDQ
ncbi:MULTISPECIES: DUF3072 domain-containing protein [Kocuria]|jgi:hypothetical protein|uniref:DUF3072 domain-containing protein n=1 Tax=Kocuria oceani TaxID=988827 RepID=A0ABV9TGX1_9MICC|nr:MULTISPECIES: DUF3072 domain-containing protein [Kocuria]KLU11489.1 hypothetical protein ABL57_01320 [Kocuria sp. SM24M-10]OLT08119.1 DUF3072 domain-containing protein [Kocuria sp. CNJ-770]